MFRAGEHELPPIKFDPEKYNGERGSFMPPYPPIHQPMFNVSPHHSIFLFQQCPRVQHVVRKSIHWRSRYRH